MLICRCDDRVVELSTEDGVEEVVHGSLVMPAASPSRSSRRALRSGRRLNEDL